MLSPGSFSLRDISGSDLDSSSETESIDGLSDGSGLPGPLFSPSSIPGYGRSLPLDENEEKMKESVLVEYFAGWAAAHASLHRKFVAITAFPDKAYSKWGHVSRPLGC